MQIILIQRRDERLLVMVWCARASPTDFADARDWAHANGWEVQTADSADTLAPYRLRFQLKMWPPGTRLAFNLPGAVKFDLDDIRLWRTTAFKLGKPSSLNDFFRENDVCPNCKGDGCPRCGGDGRYSNQLPHTSKGEPRA